MNMLIRAITTLELVTYTTSDIFPLYFSAKNKLLAHLVPAWVQPTRKYTKYMDTKETQYI